LHSNKRGLSCAGSLIAEDRCAKTQIALLRTKTE